MRVDLLKTRFESSHPFHWVVEPLVEEPSYIEKAMFGCRGCYLYGRLVLVLAARRRDHQALIAHPILKKWLYLAESSVDFEDAARALVESILANDPRTGVEPKARSSRLRGRSTPS